MAQTVNNLPAMQETGVQFLGWEDPLEKGMATHYRILFFFFFIEAQLLYQITSVFLPKEFHGQRSLAGYNPWVHQELDTTEQ